MKITIFAASSNEIKEQYKKSAYELGFFLAKRGHCLVFGGGKDGLMGQVCNGFYDGKGEIITIAPKMFDSEIILSEKCTQKIITENIAQRKDKLIEYGDAFLVLEGGIGTFDEFFSVLALRQLEVVKKKIVIFNQNHYYDSLLKMLEVGYNNNFFSRDYLHYFSVASSIEEVVKLLEE